MRLPTIFLAGLLMVIMTLPAMAQSKFENKDTAEDRQDYTWGTRKTDEDSGGYHGKTERGDASWGNKVEPQEEQKNPADDMIIVVEPDVKYGDQTTTTTTKDAAGDVTGSTTTTTDN